ncbi:Tryptophan/tyrosine permease [Hirschfeldia incana]|nr:Tryptophan/tyrosine permease [Hirschfeldia incana]
MALPLRQHCLIIPTKSNLPPQNALPRTLSSRRSFLKFSDRRHILSSSPPTQLTIKDKKPISPLLVRCRDNDEHQSTHDEKIQTLQNEPKKGKSFWAAVSLIIGTAVGPGMLGLPAATIRSGSIPSTVALLCSWVYVISSILLVAELSFAAMEEDNASEVSFTSLATKSFGDRFGIFVAFVYASLSFALMVACVSGIGSIVSQWFPNMNPLLANAIFPLVSGTLIGFFPFDAIDVTNRCLCFLMLFSITSLVAIGLSVARSNVLASFGQSCWKVSSVLPAVPVMVLTLGFHVITPFICNLAGDSVSDARRAVLVGGVVPFVMVLSWNLIVLGLARINVPVSSSSAIDPISLLLSVNPSALSAVQGFAFSALATSLIGYAVSFPKQLLDTWKLVFKSTQSSGSEPARGRDGFEAVVMLFVLGVPALIATYFPSTFSRALDFAGVYANCFLFGVLPPAMAYIQQSRKKLRLWVLPGGNFTLLVLFVIAVILGIWH